MIHSGKTILVVDDEPMTRAGISKTLEAWSLGRVRVLSAENGAQALEILDSQPVHLIVTDIRMPEFSGLHVVEKLRGKGMNPVVIVISSYPDFEYAQTAIQLGVVNYLLKPVSKRKLIEAVEQAMRIEEDRERLETLEKIADPQLLNTKADELRYSPPIQSAVRYVEENLQSPLGMREVAGRVHLNPSYFSVLFKEQTGLTFSEYVTRIRLRKAKELLIRTRLPISEISEQVGYQTPKYFIKLFKDYEGKSPSQYRKEMTGEPDAI
ncbi:response regulator [Paenibacillus thermoaerophilus]|jgi:two-component system response regulator YesN|uniref:Response regulator n=1 Tax=Paenibacillus thermoaerophilus TaxID=1215385 RepID=A0ABW2V9V4_9BACL|nr:response regulator [Paenibacillus thermoaerophilus]TMV06668.1 response regulator [Paenibacillus thermoaerophilus]